MSEIWAAAEALSSPELQTRWVGVRRLIELGAHRTHPLVAYLLATRIMENDMALRARVIEAAADALTAGANPAVFASLTHFLGGMRTRPIYALLQAPIFDTNTEPLVATLLSYCSYAGDHLGEIAANRDAPIEVRIQAVSFIGRLGFLDALPVLERLAARMDLRLNGRSPNLEKFDEANLLLQIRQVVELLKAP
ncbi:MAG: hypothetical protein ACKOC5_09650 [Chloroflexota bacterium]